MSKKVPVANFSYAAMTPSGREAPQGINEGQLGTLHGTDIIGPDEVTFDEMSEGDAKQRESYVLRYVGPSPMETLERIRSGSESFNDFDEWDGAGNSKILGLRESHPLTPAGLEHDREYWIKDKPRHQVTGRFLYKGWLDTISTVWDAASAVTVMTAATVIVPIWDLFRYKQKPTSKPE